MPYHIVAVNGGHVVGVDQKNSNTVPVKTRIASGEPETQFEVYQRTNSSGHPELSFKNLANQKYLRFDKEAAGTYASFGDQQFFAVEKGEAFNSYWLVVFMSTSQCP